METTLFSALDSLQIYGGTTDGSDWLPDSGLRSANHDDNLGRLKAYKSHPAAQGSQTRNFQLVTDRRDDIEIVPLFEHTFKNHLEIVWPSS